MGFGDIKFEIKGTHIGAPGKEAKAHVSIPSGGYVVMLQWSDPNEPFKVIIVSDVLLAQYKGSKLNGLKELTE